MKFNKNKCFFASVYVAAVSAVILTGFTSYAAEQNAQINETLSLVRGEEIQWGVSEIVQNAQKTTVEETLAAVNEAKAVYEAKLEEERKAAEEAERIAREQAEKAATLQAEKELLASLIFCEAGNQPYEGQIAVGAVVLNRVKSSVYPNSVSEVIYQSGQFSPAMSGWLDRVRANAGYSESALQAAEDALDGSNPVGDCLYFSTGGYGMQIGDHFFH
nr:cell wall hydrolase [uncultured Mediterraneibacter sp.]